MFRLMRLSAIVFAAVVVSAGSASLAAAAAAALGSTGHHAVPGSY